MSSYFEAQTVAPEAQMLPYFHGMTENSPMQPISKKFGSVSDLVGMTAPLNLNCSTTSILERIAIENPEKRITIWNRLERRKISGNAAPMGKNLISYLNKHPHCEVYDTQDKTTHNIVQYPVFPGSNAESAEMTNSFSLLGGGMVHVPVVQHIPVPVIPEVTEKRVTIWHKEERRKISGNAAPMEKNLNSYLQTHPMCEIYTNQDKDPCKAEPCPIPEEQQSNSQMPLDTQSPLTPMAQFAILMEERASKFMPIPSPLMPAMTSVQQMSPVDSLSSSFSFSLGSQSHVAKRIRKFSAEQGCEEDRFERRASLSEGSEGDDFGVMGKLEGV